MNKLIKCSNILILSVIIVILVYHTNSYQEESSIMNFDVRLEIKNYIDEIFYFDIFSIEHTTWSKTSLQIRLPKKPKPFEAGRYKISFKKGTKLRTVICQTEETVSHMSRIVPGKTEIGGFIQLLDDPMDIYSTGLKFNNAELDYFIQKIYEKFSKPISVEEERLLNNLKDYSLAIMFSGEDGIDEYHKNQLKKLKRKEQH